MSHKDDPKFDGFPNPEEEQDQDQVDLDTFFEDTVGELELPEESHPGENTTSFADELDMFGDMESQVVSSEGTEIPMGDMDLDLDLDMESTASQDQPDFDAAVVEEVPIVEDKKAKKGKKEKPPKKEKVPKVKKEKPPKVKKEKKLKEPREKQPWDIAALCFMAGLAVMILAFAGVNAYAVMKYGIGMGAMAFLAIFDLLAFGALVIPILLRRSRNTASESDVSLGMAAISIIIGCMLLLANIAVNLSGTH